jgi:hypothetical protein
MFLQGFNLHKSRWCKATGRGRGAPDVAERESYLAMGLIKWFEGHGHFRGVVSSYDSERDVYNIVYEDEDEEEMTYNDMKAAVFRHAPAGSSVDESKEPGRWFVTAKEAEKRAGAGAGGFNDT